MGEGAHGAHALKAVAIMRVTVTEKEKECACACVCLRVRERKERGMRESGSVLEAGKVRGEGKRVRGHMRCKWVRVSERE